MEHVRSVKVLDRYMKRDLDQIIPDNTKSISELGIVPLGEVRDTLTYKQLKQIADRYKFNYQTPIKKIPKKALDTILYGGDDSFPAPPVQPG
jgi:excinuclease ABC subunit A